MQLQRKHIDISSQQHGSPGICKNWVKTVPANNFSFTSVDGVNVATIGRTYYYSDKDDTVHWFSHNNDNPNNLWQVCVFGEVYPGIFVFAGKATRGNISQRITSAAAFVGTLDATKKESFRASLVRY